MISHKYNCIFVHIPKAGGTSIEDLIWPSKRDRTEENLWGGFIDGVSNRYQTGGLQHLTGRLIREAVGQNDFDRYYKFTFARNPWDKAVSQFSYMKTRSDARTILGLTQDTDFKTYLSLIRKVDHVQWKPQYEFFLDENGDQMVDFVGRLENFNEDVMHVINHLDVRKGLLRRKIDSIPHSKKSSRSHYKDYYDAESREIVAEMYQRDIELLNYTFD
ncbi:MAG: sulfotransferase family 2 domain-containing protein [Pseudomonadota bacterium]